MNVDDLGERYDPRDFREASDWPSTSVPPTGIEVLVPEGWSTHSDLMAPVIVTMLGPPSERAGDFRPSITLTVEQPDEEWRPIEAYTTALIAGLRANLTGAHVLAIDPVWVGGFEGRRVITGYPQGRHTLVAQQYWTVGDGGVATVMTGTSTIEQYLWASEIFAHVASGLTVASVLPAR